MRSGDIVWRVLAAVAVLCAPAGVHAQSRNADAELEALIPDSAIDDPRAWSMDTDAARTKAPDVDRLTAPDALAPPTDIPSITIPWPDTADLPAITPLEPDPDIGMAEEQAKAAGEALDKALPEGDMGRAALADAEIAHVGNQVELAFPRDATFPERDAVVARFAGLSSLKALDKDDDNLAQLSRRAKEDTDLLQRVLRLYGYYDAEVTQSLSGFERPAEGGDVRGPVDVNKVVVRFDVVPGPQYRLAQIALGDIAQASDAADLRAAFALQPGDPVNADRIEEERGHLDVKLGRSGYAFAEVGEPHLLIDHAPRTGDLTLPVTTGGKYAYGAITSSLPKYLSARHLQTMARFRPGQIYDRAMVDDLRQAILATGLVSSVTVKSREAAKPAGAQPGTVDLDVTIAKAPQRTIAGLIGYSSGEGVRLEASWENRNLFPPEGMLRLHGVAGTREQLAGVTFRRNNFMARDQVLTADLYAQTKKTDAYDARTASFITTLEKQTTLIFQKPWVYSIGLQAIATSEVQSGDTGRSTYFIGALPLHAGYDGSNDLLDPTRGFRIGLSVSPELSVTDGRKSKYVKAQFDASYYQPVTERVVIAARTRVGTIQGTALDNIAPSRRFYAGGGASVRGYSYQGVGPKDDDGDPTGGRSLTEFSLEARVKTGLVGGAVSLVPFIDAGTVGTGTSPTLSGMQYGVGLGVRYQTNFGPIRIDVGTPLNRRKGDGRIGVYVALGQAF